jgi:hypothetical protein
MFDRVLSVLNGSLTSVSFLTGLGWLLLIGLSSSAQGAGTAASLLYILIYPLQLALTALSAVALMKAYELSLISGGAAALICGAVFCSLIIPAMLFFGYARPSIASSHFGFFGIFILPSVVLLLLAGLLHAPEFAAQSVRAGFSAPWTFPAVAALSLVVGLGLYDFTPLRAKTSLQSGNKGGMERLCLFQTAYKKQVPFLLQERLSHLCAKGSDVARTGQLLHDITYDPATDRLTWYAAQPVTEVEQAAIKMRGRFPTLEVGYAVLKHLPKAELVQWQFSKTLAHCSDKELVYLMNETIKVSE